MSSTGAGPPTVPATVEHQTNPDSDPSITGAPISAHDLTNPPQYNDDIGSERPVQQTNSYHLPNNHQKKLLRGRMMISNGTISTSGGNHSFRGVSTSRENQLQCHYTVPVAQCHRFANYSMKELEGKNGLHFKLKLQKFKNKMYARSTRSSFPSKKVIQ